MDEYLSWFNIFNDVFYNIKEYPYENGYSLNFNYGYSLNFNYGPVPYVEVYERG